MMRRLGASVGVALLIVAFWAGFVLLFVYPLIGVPLLGAALASIYFGARYADRRENKAKRALQPAPTAPAWHIWDEELPETLSQTEVDMLRKTHVRKPADPVDKRFYTAVREALGELPLQRDGGEQ